MRAWVVVWTILAVGCDKPAPGVAAILEAGAAPAPQASASATAKPRPPASAFMPPRPIPKPQNTVGSGDPQEVQMKAIAYMTAMAQPAVDEPPVDEPWVKHLVTQLTPIVRAMDKGSAAAKARLDKIELVGGGRRVDLLMASGCEAQTPARAVQNASTPLATLHDHGVLVVRCNDSRVQCLQSTREEDDILCTTAPRRAGTRSPSSPK